MKNRVLAVEMMIMPFRENAPQNKNEQVTCHKNAENVLHCYVSKS